MTTSRKSTKDKAIGRTLDLTVFMQEQIARLTECRRYGTARNYQQTLNSLRSFLDGRRCTLGSFTREKVEEYNSFLMRRGVVRNTISFYMRILRSVYNQAVDKCLVKQKFPFSSVYTGVDNTRKRAVDEQVIGRLLQLDLQDSRPLSLARDLFVFSFCTRGMAFVDIAFLCKRNVSDGVIRYVRRKTGQQLCIRLEPCMSEIIDRYRCEGMRSGYIFPLLNSTDPGIAYLQYQTALGNYNRRLKELSFRLGLERALTSYTARHSWATTARDHNIPISVISAGMGHSSERTTQIYLSSMENTIVDRANHDLLANLQRVFLSTDQNHSMANAAHAVSSSSIRQEQELVRG